MNTDKMIPIDFPRNITPYVAGDKMWNTVTGHEFVLINDEHADKFNVATDTDKDFFVVSFADRPNTGTQPVGDDVILDMTHSDGELFTGTAGSYLWEEDDLGIIVSWKPNHAALLDKFKEQGANTMFTFENTKEATEFYLGSEDYFEFFVMPNISQKESISDRFFGKSRITDTPDDHYVSLSRPPGERKEDHTIDGVTTYALTPVRQYDDQEAELATHYSGNNNSFYIQGYGMKTFSKVLSNGKWILSDCTTNAELDGDEFWKLDGNINNQLESEEQRMNKITPSGNEGLHYEQAHHIAIMTEKLGSRPANHIDLAISGDAVQDVREPTSEQQENMGPGVDSPEINAATALYAFAGWLTSMKEPITFSEKHWATPAAEMVASFIELNGLGGDIDFVSVKTPSDSVIPRITVSNPASTVEAESGATDKPVFTQEMKKADCECYFAGKWVEGITIGKFGRCTVIAPTGGGFYGFDDEHIRPIDNRTEHEKALDWMSEYKSIPKMMLCDIKDGKCPWLKWVGE